jgi:hypothetical protein
MDKKEIILAAMASSSGADYSPVQIQKLLFLLDKKIPTYLNGPHFKFVPYAYGPFAIEIYQLLDGFDNSGEVNILHSLASGIRKYRLTKTGQQEGEKLLGKLDSKIRDYMAKLSVFVRSLSFAELVSSIYNEYPEMKKNSVFRKL